MESIGTSPAQLYGEILRRVPREMPVTPLLKMSQEESNVVQWANAYYRQLNQEIEPVGLVETEEDIVTLCEKIQILVPTIIPEDPTQDFMGVFKDDKVMGRVYQYFNREMKKVLAQPLTKTELETSDSKTMNSKALKSKTPGDNIIDPIALDPVALDQLALSVYQSGTETIDPERLDHETLDQLALSVYQSSTETIDPETLDQLALSVYQSSSDKINPETLDQLALKVYQSST